MALRDEKMAAERTEQIVMFTDEDSSEVKELSEIDRGIAIVKRLDAISASVSFHSEFLQFFAEMQLLETKGEDSKDATKAEKSELNEDEDNHQTVKCSKIKDDVGDTSIEAEHSSDDIGQRSDESDDDDATSVPDSPDNRDNGNLRSPGDQSGNSGTTGNTELDNDMNRLDKTADATKEKQLNVQYCYKFNLFSTLFLSNCKLSKAKTTNEKVLLVMPDNFNALWNKVKLMIAMAKESGDCIDETAEEILNQLEQTVSNNGKEILIAKAEIAAMYTDLPVSGDALTRCIRLYEKVLDEANLSNQNESAEYLPEKLVIFWKCYLVKAYAMLTNANKELLANHGFHHGEVLSRLEELVLAVDSSEHIANKLTAQTWVNLANTFEHYKRNYPMDRFRQDIYDGQLSLADCFANASAYDPDNCRILMRTGRELRQRSNSEQDLHEAIKYFERALKGENVDDIIDIIYHHLGLTYRSLWLLTESPMTDSTTDDAYHLTRIARPIHPLGCRVIKPPDHPLDFDLIPRPYKRPPKAAFWKILNPIARNPENPYLLKARKCFEEASLLDHDSDELSNSLYLMEIARTYSSARDVEKAREYQLKAEQQPSSDIVDVDFVGNSLYENIGLLEEEEMIRKDFNEVDAEKVKSFYRESIRLSTISKTKPIVSFYYILRILYKQLERCVDGHSSELDQMIIQNEYFLLYMAIQEAEDGRDIVNCVATDDFRIALIWRLIESFHLRNQQHDAAAAFTYLSILVMAKKLTVEVKGIDLTHTEKQRILIQSAERVTLQRVEQPRFLPEPYRELHALREDDIAENESDCRNIGLLPTLTDMERKKLDIVMKIIQPGFSPGYTRLTEQCY